MTLVFRDLRKNMICELTCHTNDDVSDLMDRLVEPGEKDPYLVYCSGHFPKRQYLPLSYEKILKRGKKLGEYNLTDQSVIYWLCQRKERTRITLKCNLFNSKVLDITVEKTAQVKKIYESVVNALMAQNDDESIQALSAEGQTIYLYDKNNNGLNPESSFENAKLDSGDTVFFTTEKSFQIFIRLQNNKTVEVDVFGTSTTEDVAKLLYNKKNICPDQIRLIYNGHQLEHGRTLDEYGISEEVLVRLMM
jgi:hypothetical protein